MCSEIPAHLSSFSLSYRRELAQAGVWIFIIPYLVRGLGNTSHRQLAFGNNISPAETPLALYFHQAHHYSRRVA